MPLPSAQPATMKPPSGISGPPSAAWAVWNATLQDYRQFGTPHARSCQIAFADGSVRAFIDETKDGALNNGFPGTGTNRYSDGTVELPPNDEKPRLRVALAPEAAALLAALAPEDRLPYAIAFYAGLRRSEIYRLEWDDVLEGDAIATRLIVRRSKSEAGTQRRPPIADNLRVILAAAWDRQGRPRTGKVVDRSVMSGKIAARVDAA